MLVLELGNYLVPSYAGMILAEQGHHVTKVTSGHDPILSLTNGEALWKWVNAGKKMIVDPDADFLALIDQLRPDIVLDNFRPSTMLSMKIDPVECATEYSLVWVSMRADVGDTSFDVIAQARSWMEYGPYLPIYAGDTTGGLWMAFKALSARSLGQIGHHVLYHATCMQKLVEGELVVTPDRNGVTVPWDRDLYTADRDGAHVAYKGRRYDEPIRDRQWKRENLKHRDGRMVI